MTAIFTEDNLLQSTTDVRLLRLRSAGMFSNVNEVVEQLRLAEEGEYRFVIDWKESCYRDPNRKSDPWEYYFEPCFSDKVPDQRMLPDLPRGRVVACTRNNIITPRQDEGQCNPLLLPRDRLRSHDLISRYLCLKPEVAAKVDQFQAERFRPHMIGLHIRGAGRIDGGVPELRRRFGKGNQIPVEIFFQQVDEALRLLPEAGIFACSDSSVVIDAVSNRYGNRVVVWPAHRSVFGEMHANHVKNKGMIFPPFQLGLDVICEAMLLSHTNVFIHGNSNVANFVICKSPHLLHAYVRA